jgi:hypothetical protein
MKVYMKISNRDQLDIATKNLRALNFAHVKLQVVTPPISDELVFAHESVSSGNQALDKTSPRTQAESVADLSDTQLSVDDFVLEVSKLHGDLIVVSSSIDKAELAQLIENTPCSVFVSRCCMDSEFSIKSVLATDHTLYANLAIEKFRSFRPSGFSGATVISTELNGEMSSGVAEAQSMRIPDVEAARNSESASLPQPLLKAITQECRSRGANLLMIATHSLRGSTPGTLGGLLGEIIDGVDASVLILKAY